MGYLEKVDLWKNYKDLDLELKEELNQLNEKELEEAFALDLSFGTGGLRGLLGVGTNRMNIYIVRKATLGFGRFLLTKDNAKKRGVAIAYDNRKYSKEFAKESAKVLSSLGFEVYLFEELRPTPELSFAVRHFNCVGGIMITASHNPKEYNGYKVYDENGCQLLPEDADLVIKEINKIDDYFNIEVSKNLDKIKYIGKEVDKTYIREIKEVLLRPNLDKNLKIVYTPLHGTGQVFVVDLLKELGYHAIPVESQMTNDPNFSNVKSSNPEDKIAYEKGIELAKQIDADVVFATDPDADRLGIAVRHQNDYIFLTGNQIGALLLNYILKTRKEFGILPKKGYVFTTNVSSSLAVLIANKYGMNVGITLTGFKYIGDKAKEIENKGEFVFGYEESYGYLISDVVRDKDSIQSIIMLAEVTAFYKEKGLTLVDALDQIFKEYGYYLEGITNITLKGLAGSEKILKIMSYFRNNLIHLNSFEIIGKEDCKLSVKEDYLTKEKIIINLPKSNVIKYILNDDMWFVLRPSGTEPKLKVYYGVVGESLEESKTKLNQLTEEVLDIVNKIN